jgi:hypothetical protein
MKRRAVMQELARLARTSNVTMTVTEGGKHTKVELGSMTLIVPRHNEVNEMTARGILKTAREGLGQ